MSRLLLVKLLRDLRGTWARLLLMVIAISVSLTVFSAVLYTRTITDREILRSYLSTHPASATLQIEGGVDADRMAAIAAAARTRPGVLDAAARAQFTTQIRRDGGGWQTNPLQVFIAGPGDPLRIAIFKIEKGSWPPAPGEILIERGTLQLLDLAVGDTVMVKTPSGKAAQLRVSGVAYDPSLAPAAQEQKGYGFISASTLRTLGENVAMDQLKIQVGNGTPTHDRDAVTATGRSLASWLQQTYGLAVREVQVPEPYAHPHQGQLDALLVALLVFGAAALLLSGVLVATMLNGLFAQQIPQIGIMKAIGARSSAILRLYLLMTLLMAVTATALAFLPGLLISRTWAPTILMGLLGVNATSLAPGWWTYPLVLAFGIGLPPLMALVPLIKTSRTTVRAALDHHGTAPKMLAVTRLDAWLSRLRGLSTTMLLALRNTVRRRARFLLSVGLLASAGTLFVAGMSTLASVQAIPDQAQNQRRWDIEVQLTGPQPATALTSLVQQVAGVRRVEAWNVAPSAVTQPGQIAVTHTYPDQAHGSIAVTALPTGTTMLKPSSLLEGRWLRPGETDAVVLNQIARAQSIPGVAIGDTVQLSIAGRPTKWRVVGVAREAFVGTGVYVSQEGLAKATGLADQTNDLRIATSGHDEGTRTSVASAVERALANASIKVGSSTSVGRMEAAGSGHMLPIIMILLVIAGAMAVVGCIGLASTMSANVLERTREFGIMHAIGARPSAVRRIVITEGIFIALASCAAAIVPTLILTAVMGAGLGNLFLYTPLPFRLSAPAIGIWIGATVIGAALATRAPASRASRLTVREALAYL
jgi:putative ABC transport system permease protein